MAPKAPKLFEGVNNPLLLATKHTLTYRTIGHVSTITRQKQTHIQMQIHKQIHSIQIPWDQGLPGTQLWLQHRTDLVKLMAHEWFNYMMNKCNTVLFVCK